MRVILEFEDKEKVPVIYEEAVTGVPGEGQGMDGGAPPESLLQLVEAAAPEPPAEPESTEAIDGGPPPKELVAALQEAGAMSLVEGEAGTDAGAAPDT